MRRLASLLVALLLPPLGLRLHAGTGRLLILVTLAWGLGLAIFFLVAAGPGFLLILAATLLAVLGILFGRPRRARHATERAPA